MTLSRVSRGFSVAIVMVAAVLLRVFFSGLDAYKAGRASLEANDFEEAIVRFRRAASWYLPASPIVRRSLDALESIGKTREAAGDWITARKAWEGERAAILGARSLFVPHKERLVLANERIAHLMVAVEGHRPGETSAEQLGYHQNLLSRDLSFYIGWTLLALMGFACWVAGALLFVLRGLRADDTLRVRPAFLGGLLIVVGFGAFMAGLAYA